MLQPDGEDKAVTIRWARRRSLAVAFVGDRRGWVDSIRRPAPRANAWGARTYDGVPSVASVRAGTRYLVTINMAADPAGCAYPQRHRYPRLRALGGPGAGSMA